MGSFVRELTQIFHPHFVGNVFLAIAYYILKTLPPACQILFEDCQLELKEYEWLTFLGCIIVLKNRKQSSYQAYIGTVCMFAKILGAFLFFRASTLLGVIYLVLCLLHLAFLPEPTYSGPDLTTFFTAGNLEEELERDKRVTWVVEFYAAWSPNCVSFAPTFAQLSAKYSLDNLKFGKIDVTRFPKEAEKYMVSAASWSKQLPTIILFQHGKESRRRPVCDIKGRVLAKFIFNEENVMRDFELNEIYHQCKKHPLSKKNKKTELNSEDGGGNHEKKE